jgi:hypothetical protein
MMTRKDYIKVAEILNRYYSEIDPQVMKDLLSEFNTFFKRDNSNFNISKFTDAVMK